jgi:hypothetical protein
MATLQHLKERLKRIASLLPRMPKDRPMYRGNHAITILRVFLWLIPSLFIPLGIVLCVILGEYLPNAASFSITLLLAIAATAGIGLFEQLLIFQQMRQAPAKAQREWVISVTVFVLLQVVIAPVICFGAILMLATFWH